ncbi:COG3650 family protein [Sagittula sp. S175]|uniref:COG3650 family protein n=1 Tax=Sagittula sp. S175 TaxID=3415129 RepID=UPI003C7C1E10
MLRFVLAFVMICAASVANAQEGFPALYDVSGVGADDALNVRAGPGVNHGVVGALAHDQKRVEVLGVQGNWAQVNTGEVAGWASLKFLEPRPAEPLADAKGLRCFGTEPFWELDITPGDTARLRKPDSPLVDVFQVGALERAPAMVEKHVLRGVGAARELAVVVQPAQCSDGMSDRSYALDVTVIVTGAQGPTYAGCCSLAD